MRAAVQSFRAQAQAQAKELLRAVEAAEGIIVSTIERECEALRAGRMLAANALRMRLHDAAKLYLNITRAARAAMWTVEQILPGTGELLEQRRAAFAALLRVELAVLAAERAAAEPGLHFSSTGRALAKAEVKATAPVRTAPRRRQRMRRAS
jgi:hypothetical protein